ncbi:MAG: EAL domain-containing protein [Nitrosomonadales bacterium]|nr:EAL domain-containing protein [Nitrosomonadales bacterium]
MQVRNLIRAVRPFISAMAVIATAAVLVFTMYFTELGPQWIMFLAGILVAAILAEATRVSRAEWVTMRRTAQLASVKDKLDRETQLRKRAEAAIAAGKPRLHLIDEALPTMVAFIDVEGKCQYHNRAFMKWLRLRPEQINGRHMREVLGAKVYQETATAVRQSLDGHPVHYDRTQTMPDGAVYRLSVEHIPQFGEDGKVAGFHMLINDITAPGDVHVPAQPEPKGVAHAASGADMHVSAHDGKASQDMYVNLVTEQVIGEKNISRIKAAIENGAFRLFCQLITPITVDAGEAEHYEILVRLIEEEEKLIPPGAFFPLADKYGLMPNLDRWVVQHVTEWASRQYSKDEKRNSSMYFINVSGATIGDPGFPEFLQLTLQEHGLPGAVLCFEIPNSELALRAPVVAEFARQIEHHGCRLAISGFGRDKILFDLIRGFRVEFFKIDGSIIFDILRDPVALARITAINRVAKKIGVKTIAELVESEETIKTLKEIGIDFAQGFAISRPRPLAG